MNQRMGREGCVVGGPLRAPSIVPGGILDQQAGYLGGKVDLAPGGVEQGRVLNLTARDNTKTQTYVLSFDVQTETDAAGPALNSHLLQATLNWGSAKGNGQAVIDLKHGTRVTLEGTYLSVDVRMVFTNPGAIPDAGPTFRVYASVGAGSVGKGPQLTRTTDTLAIVNAANSEVRVPNYAREIEIQSDADPLAIVPNSVEVQFQSGLAAIGARVIGRVVGVNTRFTLPNGCEFINIFNRGPLNQLYTPVFHLSL